MIAALSIAIALLISIAIATCIYWLMAYLNFNRRTAMILTILLFVIVASILIYRYPPPDL